MSPLATALAVSLALGQAPAAPPPPPAADPTTPTPTPPTTTPSEVPDPTIPNPTTTPGTPKRVFMPGTKKDPVVLPTPVKPTPVKPTPVVPTGPTPILPGSDPNAQTDPGGEKEPPPPRTRRKRERRSRNQGETGTSDNPSGACFAPQSRCRTFVLTGTVLASAGVAIAAAGAVFVSRPMSPLREDPTTVKSYRPPGAVMLAVGGAALISGIAVLAAGIAGNRRDQSMRRQSAWWRPRVSFGVITP